jgi:hypothetical protein
MKKLLFTLLIAIVVSIGTAHAQATIDGITYILGNNIATVYSGNNCSGHVSIPPTINYTHELYYDSSIRDYIYETRSYTVTGIEGGAFEDCTGLTSLTLPNTITNIGYGAFQDCSSLNSITIPNSVTSIGKWAFYRCTSLTSVIIPNSVTNIGKEAFRDCSSLTSVTLPSSLKIIGKSAFDDCIELKDVTTFSTIPQPINDYAFPIRITEYEDFFHGKNVKKEMFLHVPNGCKKKYSKAKYWKEFTITEDAEMINEK